MSLGFKLIDCQDAVKILRRTAFSIHRY